MRRALERTRLLEENRALRGAQQGDEPPRIESIVGRSPADARRLQDGGARGADDVDGAGGRRDRAPARSWWRAPSTPTRRARGAPFVAVNCTALTESLLESELFGHAKGAFTGAVAAKRGLFEEAQGGTLFLDEIGDVGGKMQAQLLRVLQEGEIRRVGGAEAIKVDVRVVAATNRDLEEEVAAGALPRGSLLPHQRRDHPPAAAARAAEDIPLLVEHFLAKYAARERRADAGDRAGGDGAAAALRLAGQRARAGERDRARAGAVQGRRHPAVGSAARGRRGAAVGGRRRAGAGGIVDDRPTLAELERRYIELILRETGGNKKRAAEILGIDRRTLYRTLEREGRAAEAEEDD